MIGNNGDGQKTLSNILSVEIDDSDGRISLDGEDITTRERSEEHTSEVQSLLPIAVAGGII